GWVKCTWLFQKPATTVAPVESMTVAPDGIRALARGPIAVIVSRSMSTIPSAIASRSGDTWTRPPTSAVSGGDGVTPGSIRPQAADSNATTATIMTYTAHLLRSALVVRENFITGSSREGRPVC